MKTTIDPARVAEEIPGYTFGTADAAKSPMTIADLERLKRSAGFSPEDEQYLRMAGEVLADQTKSLVETWRGVIASTPHLAKHSRTADGRPIPEYSEKSGLRFQQWILDTCFRPYDEEWLNYQQEIALRHTSLKKNHTDQVASTPYVPLRDIIAFAAVMNETVKQFLAAKGHSRPDIDKMHAAWCKSIQLQIALWTRAYMDPQFVSEW
jgi:hypothetical protein